MRESHAEHAQHGRPSAPVAHLWRAGVQVTTASDAGPPWPRNCKRQHKSPGPHSHTDENKKVLFAKSAVHAVVIRCLSALQHGEPHGQRGGQHPEAQALAMNRFTLRAAWLCASSRLHCTSSTAALSRVDSRNSRLVRMLCIQKKCRRQRQHACHGCLCRPAAAVILSRAGGRWCWHCCSATWTVGPCAWWMCMEQDASHYSAACEAHGQSKRLCCISQAGWTASPWPPLTACGALNLTLPLTSASKCLFCSRSPCP